MGYFYMWAQSAFRNFHQWGKFLPLRAPFFTAVINVWPPTNWTMVTNNLTAIIEVALMNVSMLIDVNNLTEIIEVC